MIERERLKTQAGNPSIKYPPNDGQSIPFSRPNVGYNNSPLVDSWASAPSGGTYVLASVNGSIQWIATENC